MKNAKAYKPLLYLLLTGWCLLFLRCESTEKSMVRAVYLAQTEQGYQAGLLYQAPQAAADAAEATAALQFVQAEGQTLERALDAAEQALSQTASYRLCDYLLLSKAEEPLLTAYEQLVLRRGCGRTAARLLCAEGEIDHLAAQAALPDALMAQLKAAAPTAPRLYEHTEPGLLPVLRWNAEEVSLQENGVLHTVVGNTLLSPEQAEVYRLLAGQGGTRQLWLQGERIGIRFGYTEKGAGTCAAGLSTLCPQPAAYAGAAATAGGAVHGAFARLLAAGRGCAAPASPGSAAGQQFCKF